MLTSLLPAPLRVSASRCAILITALALALPASQLAAQETGAADPAITTATGPEPILGLVWTENPPGVVTVTTVLPESPGDAAGIRQGDVIAAIADDKTPSGAELTAKLQNLRGDEKIALTIRRGDRAAVATLTAPRTTTVPTRIGLMGAFLKLDDKGRIAVEEVTSASPAAKSGLQKGDIITAISGHAPSTVDELVERATKIVTSKEAGEAVALTVIRDEKEGIVKLMPSATQGTPGSPRSAAAPANRVPALALGVVVAEEPDGLTVVDVAEAGPASVAGIAAGDVILSVAGKKVTSFPELQTLVEAAAPGDNFTVDVLRGGKAFIAKVVAVRNKAQIPDVSLATGQPSRGPQPSGSPDLAAQVQELQAQVMELTKTVEVLAQEVADMKKGQ